LGHNITYRPGSRLIKIPSVPEVYAVEPGGVLRNIPSEEAAQELFGNNWADYIDDINIAFFFDYTIGGVIDIIDGTPIFPSGTVVGFEGNNYLMDKRTDGILLLREITDVGWENNSFGQVQRHSLTNNQVREFTEYGIPLILPEARLSCPSCGAARINKKDVTQTFRFTSENNKYSLDLPKTWKGDSGEGNPVVIALEGSDVSILDGFAENLFINYWSAEEYNNDLDNFLVDFEATMQLAGFDIHYSGNSRIRTTGADVVSVSPEGYINWSHLVLKVDTIYQFQFTGEITDFGTYTDILHLILTSYEINALIAD